MRAVVVLVVMALAGCAQWSPDRGEASAGRAGPPSAATLSAADVPWQPGFSWQFAEVDGLGRTAMLDVLAPATLEGRTGHYAAVKADGQATAFPLWLAGPDALVQNVMPPSGPHDEWCASLTGWHRLDPVTMFGPYTTPPLVQFPLEVGRGWSNVTDAYSFTDGTQEPPRTGTVSTIVAGEVVAFEPVSVPAGTFDAYRIEIRSWQEATPGLPAWAGATTREEAQADLPAMILHYAPDARQIVRMDHALPSWPVPGAYDALHLYVGGPRHVAELTAFSLTPAPAWSQEELRDLAGMPCPAAASHPPRLSVSIAMDSGATEAGYPPETFRVHTYTDGLPPEDVHVSWVLRAGTERLAEGTVDASEDGVYVPVGLPRADRYLFEVTASYPDAAPATSSYTLYHDMDIEADIQCGPLAPHMAACDHVSLPMGHGVTMVRLDLDGEWTRPGVGGSLVLRDGAGVEVARHTAEWSDLSRWSLNVEPDWTVHEPGEWTVEWEPTAGHTQARLEARVWVH